MATRRASGGAAWAVPGVRAALMAEVDSLVARHDLYPGIPVDDLTEVLARASGRSVAVLTAGHDEFSEVGCGVSGLTAMTDDHVVILTEDSPEDLTGYCTVLHEAVHVLRLVDGTATRTTQSRRDLCESGVRLVDPRVAAAFGDVVFTKNGAYSEPEEFAAEYGATVLGSKRPRKNRSFLALVRRP